MVLSQGYLFAGYLTSTAPNDAAWDDWFRVTLAAGSGQVALTNLSSDITGAWSLYDTNGTILGGTAIGSNAGSSVVSTRMGITAGDYYVKVSAFGHPAPSGNGSNLPDFALHAYTLTVTQP